MTILCYQLSGNSLGKALSCFSMTMPLWIKQGPYRNGLSRSVWRPDLNPIEHHLWLTTWIRSYVAKCEMVFFTLNKSRDSELQNVMSYTAFEEQWESYSALKVDQLVNSLLRKVPLNVLASSMSTPIQHHSQPLKLYPHPSCFALGAFRAFKALDYMKTA